MARFAYPSAVKREAVALAKIVGAEAAVERLGLRGLAHLQATDVGSG